jgi:hypothetical protein
VVKDPVFGKRLVAGDPVKVRAVRLIFRLYAEKGYSLDMVANELYERGILNPSGGQYWDKTTIHGILTNRKYIGDAVWNMGHDGKYSEVTEGAVRTSDSRIPLRTRNAKGDWIVVPDVHEAIIEREQFEQVQARLLDNQKLTAPRRQSSGPYLLSGLLVCGGCGWRMTGHAWEGKHHYICGLYHKSGNLRCGCNSISESKLVACILAKLQATLLNPKNLAKVRKEAERQRRAFEQERPNREREMRQQFEALETKIRLAIDRTPIIPDGMLTEYGAMIRGLQEERERLGLELDKLHEGPPELDIDPIIQKVEEKLYALREATLAEDPVQARAFLRQMLSKVELFFDKVPNGKKVKNAFRRGVIYLRPQQSLEVSESLPSVRRDCRSSRSP